MKLRIDNLLIDRGFFESRAKASAAVMAGEVFIGKGMERAKKPGQMVDPEIKVDVKQHSSYVSRGGLKLEHAINEFALVLEGESCLDVGASSGGFTDCMLQRGASSVIAIDVSYGQLNWKLRNDPRVTVIERTNARYLSVDQLPCRPTFITADLSFISLLKVLPNVISTASEGFRCLALVKPQFEVGRELVGKGGVVRSASDRRDAVISVATHIQQSGNVVKGICFSGYEGPAGNRESFILFSDTGKGISDLKEATLAVDI